MAQTKKQQIVTTGRGGPVRLVLGCLMIALGCGWSLALLAQSASAYATLTLLRDTAHGLGGILCAGLPVLALWGGALLCVSSGHKVSVRTYWLVLTMYWLALAIATLMTDVGEQPLLIYIANCNKSWLGIHENTSFSACLTGAYQLRAFNHGELAGGGLLGMVWAWIFQASSFGTVGGGFILCAVELVLLLVLFRFNLFDLWRKAQENSARPEEENAPAPMENVQHRAPEPREKCKIPIEPLIPQQQVTYSAGTSVQSDVEESYLVPDDLYADAYPDICAMPVTPEDRGFVEMQEEPLYDEVVPVGDVKKEEPTPVEKRTSRRAQRHEQKVATETPASVFIEKTPADVMNVAMPVSPTEKEEDLPWYQEGETPQPLEEPFREVAVEQQKFKVESVRPAVLAPKKETVVPAQPSLPERKSGVRAGSHTSGEIKQVYTDPAFDLGGERVVINPYNDDSPKIDPFAPKHTREAMRAVSVNYARPDLTMLRDPVRQLTDTTQEDNERARQLEHTLKSFNIDAQVEYVVHGPAITRFAIKLADGVNVNRINNIANNLALTMKAVGLRIEIPIPGTSLVGIEVPNRKVSMVTLKEVLNSEAMLKNASPTAVAIGKDIMGQPVICDLSDMPHLLIAGATGSGKSVCISSIIMSILYRATPQQVRMLMIDPKLVELQPYNGIPHLLTEVVSDPKKAAAALDWVVQEMGDRYRRFQQTGVRNIAGYNKKMKDSADHMPDIVVIIDEFSDLMVQCRKQVEESIQRLAALARAAGIYMVVATQRPSVDVITGVIKANIPSRIAFAVANNVDSRTIIDSNGAEKLLGKGDMLYFPRSEFRPVRVQGCFVSDDEVSTIADFIKENNDVTYDNRIDEHMERMTQEAEAPSNVGEMEPEYQKDTENELLQKAIQMAVESGQMSISMLRRRLGLGHSRAGKLVDMMADMGIISADEGPKPRRTLITREDYARIQAQIMDE